MPRLEAGGRVGGTTSYCNRKLFNFLSQVWLPSFCKKKKFVRHHFVKMLATIFGFGLFCKKESRPTRLPVVAPSSHERGDAVPDHDGQKAVVGGGSRHVDDRV